MTPPSTDQQTDFAVEREKMANINLLLSFFLHSFLVSIPSFIGASSLKSESHRSIDALNECRVHPTVPTLETPTYHYLLNDKIDITYNINLSVILKLFSQKELKTSVLTTFQMIHL